MLLGRLGDGAQVVLRSLLHSRGRILSGLLEGSRVIRGRLLHCSGVGSQLLCSRLGRCFHLLLGCLHVSRHLLGSCLGRGGCLLLLCLHVRRHLGSRLLRLLLQLLRLLFCRLLLLGQAGRDLADRIRGSVCHILGSAGQCGGMLLGRLGDGAQVVLRSLLHSRGRILSGLLEGSRVIRGRLLHCSGVGSQLLCSRLGRCFHLLLGCLHVSRHLLGSCLGRGGSLLLCCRHVRRHLVGLPFHIRIYLQLRGHHGWRLHRVHDWQLLVQDGVLGSQDARYDLLLSFHLGSLRLLHSGVQRLCGCLGGVSARLLGLLHLFLGLCRGFGHRCHLLHGRQLRLVCAGVNSLTTRGLAVGVAAATDLLWRLGLLRGRLFLRLLLDEAQLLRLDLRRLHLLLRQLGILCRLLLHLLLHDRCIELGDVDLALLGIPVLVLVDIEHAH